MSPQWRERYCAPPVCPYGVTADSAMKAVPVPKAAGLGDMVANFLRGIGITKEFVSKVTGRPCGCSKRQEQLNAIGRRIGIG